MDSSDGVPDKSVLGAGAVGFYRLNARVDDSHMDDRWLLVDEVAVHRGGERDTVHKWTDRRSLPAHKAGRLWKLRKEEVDSWVWTGRGRTGTVEPT